MSPLLLALVLAADAGTPLDATRAQALQLYNALKYAEACPLMKQVAETLRTDSGAWSDYGLCLVRAEPPRPPAAARDALVQAWKTATTPQLRSAALFNLTLYFRANEEESSVQLSDPRCAGRSVILSGRRVLHWSERTTGSTTEVAACAPGADGGCVEDQTSRFSLGGDPEAVDPLPSAQCYPEAQERRACDELLEGNTLTKKQKATVKADDSCEALGAIFTKRVDKVGKDCARYEAATLKSLREQVASFPKWALREVDVCTGNIELVRGKASLKFKLGDQSDEMGAEGH